MAKRKKGHRQGVMGRTDIPYAQRLRMQHRSNIRINREHAATITLYCMSVAMHELEGIGYKRLIRFAARYKKYEDEFYEDPEVGMAHAKRRMDAMGMPISGEFFREPMQGMTRKQQEVHDNALQAIQVALTVGAVAMNDEFGFGEARQLKISKRVTELSDRYAREGEGFLVEAMEKMGFVIMDGRAMAFSDGEGNAITARKWLELNRKENGNADETAHTAAEGAAEEQGTEPR